MGEKDSEKKFREEFLNFCGGKWDFRRSEEFLESLKSLKTAQDPIKDQTNRLAKTISESNKTFQAQMSRLSKTISESHKTFCEKIESFKAEILNEQLYYNREKYSKYKISHPVKILAFQKSEEEEKELLAFILFCNGDYDPIKISDYILFLSKERDVRCKRKLEVLRELHERYADFHLRMNIPYASYASELEEFEKAKKLAYSAMNFVQEIDLDLARKITGALPLESKVLAIFCLIYKISLRKALAIKGEDFVLKNKKYYFYLDGNLILFESKYFIRIFKMKRMRELTSRRFIFKGKNADQLSYSTFFTALQNAKKKFHCEKIYPCDLSRQEGFKLKLSANGRVVLEK
ncbi:hypothetical protein AB834_00165 [PVC group bacterium (ex Bugula neritina AB1)]|nr:hypothetical protein AB834_00165 [PVC group bacterium (ex Bugula neritina AB1)]